MKKIIMLAILSLCLVGCGRSSSKVQSPDQINSNGEVISYKDDPSDINESENIKKCIAGEVDDIDGVPPVVVVTTSDNELVMGILVCSDQINTYKNIHVGDDISNVSDLFDYEIGSDEYGSEYIVFFDDNTEVETAIADTEDEYTCIQYHCGKNGKIAAITISKGMIVKYGSLGLPNDLWEE